MKDMPLTMNIHSRRSPFAGLSDVIDTVTPRRESFQVTLLLAARVRGDGVVSRPRALLSPSSERFLGFTLGFMKLRANRAFQSGDRVAMLEEREAEGIPVDVADFLTAGFAVDVKRDGFRADQEVVGRSHLRCRVIQRGTLVMTRPDGLHAALSRGRMFKAHYVPKQGDSVSLSLITDIHIY